MPLKVLTMIIGVTPKNATPCTKTCCATYRSLRSVHLFFAQLTVLPSLQNPVLYNALTLLVGRQEGYQACKN